ncbi:UDP-N-acetylglucosamine--N-acetylmuramyl-(pentapeptide) pyrophosphoryl-undecaprenol N-acetylglucosamine transferase [Naumannella cuiyingiana]|uniref:UDP-N-acetylglucosamine--N-acetylmuramyl-(pentapeptide) pyrophosphoryl-undecaprenol N-acetylglucosamine transferase n=1 Tax=Naumannella cuiyingiana TaxID=1347891 RepID=A0A7Z0DB64_9ACTN|nr:undecaprenyldiphospho-muramoylpentapeptide beta-N-acetylglucosaminyltransferase [Naumannella cuiyingiana]NYI72099.1 UDP-N-acetylglucosamine--N-acetylmuramyl-(pentapeptide) pyrophosphoryl-undecaprenol N-acetylglucosamine transferase [Naumannella cuiyingiana]
MASNPTPRSGRSHIVLAGGGTAGHTSPLIATAEQLREHPDVAVTALGTTRGLEVRVVPDAGIDLELIDAGPLPRSVGADLFRLPLDLLGWVRGAKQTLRRLGADAVVGFGGYVSTPVYLAARQLRLPILVHEQNAVPGIANKIGARFAEATLTTFPDTPLPGAETIGLPLRREIADLDRAAARPAARAHFGLRDDLPVLLVSGGSQGAASINTAVLGARDALLAAGVQVLHVLGPDKLTEEHLQVTDPDTGAGYHPVGYVDRMQDAYAAADLMIGRSGAGTVVETGVVGLPTVLVPFPHGNGEQVRNAEELVRAGGARLVADSAFTSTWIQAEVIDMVTDPAVLDHMSAAARSGTPGDAARVLAQRALAAARR